MELIIPKDYDPRLSIRETQDAIKYIRDTFQKEMGREMHLERISAPLFVEKSSGLNDNLNGTERPVSFDMLGIPGETLEVVHSLAKWKRIALKEYGFQPGEGLYTNMNAIRRDEELDNLHSCYVDQWDWERVITKEQRNLDTLKETVREIFKIIKHMQHEVWYKYPNAVKHLPLLYEILSLPARNWKICIPIRRRKSVKTSLPKSTAVYSSCRSATSWLAVSLTMAVLLTMTTGS